MKDPRVVWLVLRLELRIDPDLPATWEHQVQGIFTARERALEACRDAHHCMAEFVLDQELPQHRVAVSEWEWPRTQR